MATDQVLYQIAIANLSKDDFYAIFQSDKVYAEFKFAHKSSGYKLRLHNNHEIVDSPHTYHKVLRTVRGDIKKLRERGLLFKDYLFEGKLI